MSEVTNDRLLQVEINVDLDLPLPILETIRAVQQLSGGKASDSDAIPAEIYKHAGYRLMDELITLFQEMWHCGQRPQDFKGSTIVHSYKRKADRQVCDKRRDISLLNITRKIFAHILLNLLNRPFEQRLLSESQ
nr:unnamed protein product [Spirometra erinaceieuropaei]